MKEKIEKEYAEGKRLDKMPRILITGCPIGGATEKVIRAVEDNGGVVVAFENCNGAKSFDKLVDEENPDVYDALARRYLNIGCSVMTPNPNRLDLLEKKGVAQNTLILFLGDNGSDAPLGDARGYASSAPLRGKKGTEFEGGMRVPCIIGWAHVNGKSKLQKELPIAGGSVQTQFGRVTDIYPTLAALAKVEIPQSHPVDGVDLKPLLTGKTDDSRQNTFLMHFPHNHYGSYFTVYREDNWKLIYYYNPERPERPDFALYDLSADEKEQNDLSRMNKGKCVEMIKKMVTALERLPDFAPTLE